MPKIAEDVVDRILNNCIQDNNGCLIWQGETVKGYGRITIGSRTDNSRRKEMVHRVIYQENHLGNLGNLTIDHLCRNPLCCNIEHLEAVTMKENTMRGTGPTKINADKKVCPKCGGPYTKIKNSRVCRPCQLAYFKEYNKTR